MICMTMYVFYFRFSAILGVKFTFIITELDSQSVKENSLRSFQELGDVQCLEATVRDMYLSLKVT
jgi:hypothetical protein